MARRLVRHQTVRPLAEGAAQGLSPEDIADHNGRTISALLLREGPMTRQELAARLKLTEPAITGIVQRLLGAGLVSQGKRQTKTRYQAAEFSLVPSGAYGLGIERRPQGGAVALCDLAGTMVLSEEFESDEAFFAAIARIRQAKAGFPAPLGVGVISSGADPQFTVLFDDLPCFSLSKPEAVLAGEKLFGVGEPEGGLVVVLIGDQVQAGFMINGRFYRGSHGRAGAIGAMRPGLGEGTLDMAASAASFRAFMAKEGDVEGWIKQAARRLLDGVVTIAGFLSPGSVLLGGDLPEDVIKRLIDEIAKARLEKERYFVPTGWIPSVGPLSFPGRDPVYGAAVAPFIELLLPKSH
ncbi:ROK family transcriptional regulator [Allorhizobium terrae]|uniref:ROK family transcriptional regulator n=1 Tax=Allorhizobium terrae TaxID=1848972 RepID=A0A4S3ZQH3_9HYPH|nr:ROK family transcriptional regulator [Allorhizobium terrae]THF47738.1 ROK family transcriptional regulator [Allorhizobium terrae]